MESHPFEVSLLGANRCNKQGTMTTPPEKKKAPPSKKIHCIFLKGNLLCLIFNPPIVLKENVSFVPPTPELVKLKIHPPPTQPSSQKNTSPKFNSEFTPESHGGKGRRSFPMGVWVTLSGVELAVKLRGRYKKSIPNQAISGWPNLLPPSIHLSNLPDIDSVGLWL